MSRPRVEKTTSGIKGLGISNRGVGPTCKGYVYRFKTSTFMEKRGVLATVSRWIPQKRMSCKGCADCNGFNLETDVEGRDAESVECDIECDGGPVSGCYYRAEWRPDPITGPDWIDEGDGHWEMVFIKEAS